ncbi:MAG: ABC transporter permease [Deltaproteobacteria bacterium]|nr:ABC transporter permease [Deltaproteobacteria bacterium]
MVGGARIAFFARQAASNIRGEALATALSVAVVAISFLIFGAFVLLGQNMSGFFEHFAGQVQMVVYLRDDVSAAQIEDLSNALRAEPGVDTVSYLSSAAALERLRRDLLDAPEFLEGITESPIPASLEVAFRADFAERPNLRPVADRYRGRPGVASVDSGDEFSDAFAQVLAAIWAGGSVVAVFLMLSAVFIVANTIRLTIIRRRGEIENMRLVGATNAFVNAPFLIEGTFVGFVGAALAVGIQYVLYRLVALPAIINASVLSVLTGFDPSFLSSTLVFAGPALGAFVGLLGAQMSVGRYLKPS